MSRKRKKNLDTRKAWQAQIMNENQQLFYYEWLMNLACARFKWTGLPPEIDRRFLELCLLNHGLNVFFWDDEYAHYFACQAAPAGKINMYQNPTAFRAYGANGFHRFVKASDCVPIWNNYLRTPTINALDIYARRLANIDRTLDTNLNAQKMPVFVTCSQEQRLTVQNLVKQWLGNEPIVMGDEMSLSGVNIGYISAGVNFIGDKLLAAKVSIWGEILTYLGIDNTDIRKAERVQSAEVESNDEQIEESALVGLDCRRMAAELINEKYGLHVEVTKNKDFQTQNFAAIMTLPATVIGEGDEDE